MTIKRILRHWLLPPWLVRRRFGPPLLATIAAAIGESEKLHRGELRFVIEGRLSLLQLLRGLSTRQRAIEQFADQGVGHTVEHSGILIYLLLAERQVEIVADSGITAKVGQAEWDALCHGMTAQFAQGRYREGALQGIAQATRLLSRHFPPRADNPNELADPPLLL